MPTSVKSTGSQPVVLSKTTCAEAIPARGRCSEPLKIMSAVFLPRSNAYDCSPSTHRSASAMFDLPEPFGPTIAVMPLANSNVVRVAKVLYPCSSRDFRRRGMYGFLLGWSALVDFRRGAYAQEARLYDA